MRPFFYFMNDTYFAQCEAWGFNLRIRGTCMGLALDNTRGSWRPSVSLTLGGWINGEGGWRKIQLRIGRKSIGFTLPRKSNA